MNAAPNEQANAPLYEDWAGEMGARWLANLTGFEGTIAPAGDALLARADYRPGEHVLDIGCGGGATSLAIARAVAPGGTVLGIDVSPDLVRAAAYRATQAGLHNARFICADAATVTLEGEPCDRLCSRFGSMFFVEPVPAFAHLRSLLRPGGRIDLAVWGPPPENPWMIASMMVARGHIDLPAPEPRAPGPFAYEDRDYLAGILAGAGFRQIDIVAANGLLPVGGPGANPTQAQQFALQGMAFGQALLDHPADVRSAVAAELIDLYGRHFGPDQGVMMGYKVWLVAAQA